MPATKGRARGHIEQRASGRYRAIVYARVDPLTGKERYLRESVAERAAHLIRRALDGPSTGESGWT